MEKHTNVFVFNSLFSFLRSGPRKTYRLVLDGIQARLQNSVKIILIKALRRWDDKRIPFIFYTYEVCGYTYPAITNSLSGQLRDGVRVTNVGTWTPDLVFPKQMCKHNAYARGSEGLIPWDQYVWIPTSTLHFHPLFFEFLSRNLYHFKMIWRGKPSRYILHNLNRRANQLCLGMHDVFDRSSNSIQVE